MIRALGRLRWLRLHRLVYGITVLALIHFFMQSKADVYEPTIMAGLYVWLIGWRLWAAYGRVVARMGKDRTEALIAHMRKMIRDFGDEADRAGTHDDDVIACHECHVPN